MLENFKASVLYGPQPSTSKTTMHSNENEGDESDLLNVFIDITNSGKNYIVHY